MGGGCIVFTVLFYVAWESWQTAHYLFTVCTCTYGYDEEVCGFQFRSPGKFSYNQSKRYGLVYWNSILPGNPWNSTSTLLHG